MGLSASRTIIALAMSALLVPTLAAQDATGADLPTSGPTRAEQEAMAEIFALERRIEALLEGLSPEVRASVRARLERLARSPDASANPETEGSASEATGAGLEADSSPPAEPRATAAPTASDAAIAAAPGTEAADAMAATDFSFLPPPRPRTKAPLPECNTLAFFDSDGSGMISALDRHWRHFYLWSDRNGDGAIDDTEVLSAYERGVRGIAVDLDGFSHADDTGGIRRQIEVDRHIVLDLFGNGFDTSARMGDDGILVVDAKRLARGNGPELRDDTGLPLTGLQAFRRGLHLALPSGNVEAFTCP